MNVSLLYSFTWVSIQVVIFVAGFRIMYLLTRSFMSPALESVALRIGCSGEITAALILAMSMSVPEFGIAVIESVSGGTGVSHSLAISTILGSGWVTFLLIPGLVGMSGKVEIPLRVIAREVVVYGCAMYCLYSTLLSGDPTSWWMVCFVGVYGMYLGMHVYSQKIGQLQRRAKREARLIYQLTPLRTVLEEREFLERLPIHLAPTVDAAVSRMGSDVEYISLAKEPEETILAMEPISRELTVEEKLLSYFCLRALPGTPSEKYCVVALLNVLVLHLLIAAVITAIARSWSMAVSNDSTFVGAVMLALFAQTGDIAAAISLPAMAQHTLVSSMSSQCFSVLVGIGGPLILRLIFADSVHAEDGGWFQKLFGYTAFVVATFVVYSLMNTDGRMVRFGNFKYMLPVYPILLTIFLLV